LSVDKQLYPVSSENFKASLEADLTSKVIIQEGPFKVIWTSPPGPCMSDRLRHELCDGLVPSCSSYQSVSKQEAAKGFKPTGCKAFHKCKHEWTKSTVSK